MDDFFDHFTIVDTIFPDYTYTDDGGHGNFIAEHRRLEKPSFTTSFWGPLWEIRCSAIGLHLRDVHECDFEKVMLNLRETLDGDYRKLSLAFDLPAVPFASGLFMNVDSGTRQPPGDGLIYLYWNQIVAQHNRIKDLLERAEKLYEVAVSNDAHYEPVGTLPEALGITENEYRAFKKSGRIPR